MNWAIWDEIESTLLSAGICPILGVVPDNRDPNLQLAPPRADFWARVRGWQKVGWTIGLHGYQHRYVTGDGGLLDINPYSEFAGVRESEQLASLRAGVEIFRSENVRPEVWVAPAHSFDAATLRGLVKVGIHTVSDGFSLFPYTDSDGFFWVPQQLWRFRILPFGVWTVCLHPNTWTTAPLRTFAQWIGRHRGLIVDLPEVIGRYRGRQLSALDRCFKRVYQVQLRSRRSRRASTGPDILNCVARGVAGAAELPETDSTALP